MSLADLPIAPLPAGSPAVAAATQTALLRELPDWGVVDGKLARTYPFPDFARALQFVVAVGAMADAVDHHPEIALAWGKATVATWTHTVGGLAEIDFRFAARCDQLFGSLAM